jgi:hypothetical protein
MGGKRDVETIGEGDVRPLRPGVGEQASNLYHPERPSEEFVDAMLGLLAGENAVEIPAAKHSLALGKEVVRDPGHRVVGQQPPQGTSALGVDDQLYTGGGIDNDGGHTSPVLRRSASVSTARTGRWRGSPLCRRSSQARNASGVTASSGFVTTTAGSEGDGAAWLSTV